MENKVKIFKTISVILIIIAISLISFIGLFGYDMNKVKNVIPDYSYGMEIGGAREFKFTLDESESEKEVYVDENGQIRGEVVSNTETAENGGISLDATVENTDDVAEETAEKPAYKIETRKIKANEDSVLNKENYEKTKKVIQDRFENAGIPEYNMRLDMVDGDLIVEVPEDGNTYLAYELALSQGKFEIIDTGTGEILLDNSDVKTALASYNTDTAYQAYLQINFNKEGTEKLKEISKEYVQTTNEQDETTTKTVDLKLDGNTMLTTYFGEELKEGILQITMGEATTDYESFSESYDSASYFANVLKSGKTPNVYTLASDNFVKSQITEEMIIIAKIVFLVAIIIASIALIVKYKTLGILAALASVGYIATVLLAIRYTNVIITLNSLFALIGAIVVNYIFMITFLNKQKTDSRKHAFLETMQEINITIIPLWVVTIIFTFMASTVISSVGMVMFWGLFVHVLYSFIITRTLFV